jgi:type I site-specific restriction-modification system R (restriction) subunit
MLFLLTVISLLCGSSNPLPVEVAREAAQPSNTGVIHHKDEHEIKRLIEEYVTKDEDTEPPLEEPQKDKEEGEDLADKDEEREKDKEREEDGNESEEELKEDHSLTKDADLLSVFPQMKPQLETMKRSVKALVREDVTPNSFSAIQDRLQRDFIDPYDRCQMFDQRRLLGYHVAKIGLENVLENIHSACVDGKQWMLYS